jgi:hypothetical protein
LDTYEEGSKDALELGELPVLLLDDLLGIHSEALDLLTELAETGKR